jgi:hypothetical protein
MQPYLAHHLSIAGVKTQLFSPPAITAIQQGSAGLLRRANHLARRALIAAANEKCQQSLPNMSDLPPPNCCKQKCRNRQTSRHLFIHTGQNNQQEVVSLM